MVKTYRLRNSKEGLVEKTNKRQPFFKKHMTNKEFLARNVILVFVAQGLKSQNFVKIFLCNHYQLNLINILYLLRS